MVERTPNIPRVCLCGCARSGTSMMMRVLRAGGLTVDTDGSQPTERITTMMRQPYGFFENRDGVLKGEFVNSFKLIDSSRFVSVPRDYKFIFAGRSLDKIKASWKAVAEIYDQCRLATFPIEQKYAESEARFVAWQEIVTTNPGLFLALDYDATCADPAAMARAVAEWINTDTFTFDEVAAAAAVDLALYVSR